MRTIPVETGNGNQCCEYGPSTTTTTTTTKKSRCCLTSLKTALKSAYSSLTLFICQNSNLN